MTGIWHAMGKQPIIGDLCYVMLNRLKDSHLLYLLVLSLSPLVLSWRISKFNVIVMSLYTFFTSVQCQMLRYQTCNWDNHNSRLKWPWTFCSACTSTDKIKHMWGDKYENKVTQNDSVFFSDCNSHNIGITEDSAFLLNARPREVHIEVA